MPQIKFLPEGRVIDVAPETKILAAAIRNKIPIRFSCGACQCGNCGVAVKVTGALSPMEANELALLTDLGLAIDGSVRLACRTKVVDGLVEVDLDFQPTYDPEHRISGLGSKK